MAADREAHFNIRTLDQSISQRSKTAFVSLYKHDRYLKRYLKRFCERNKKGPHPKQEKRALQMSATIYICKRRESYLTWT